MNKRIQQRLAMVCATAVFTTAPGALLAQPQDPQDTNKTGQTPPPPAVEVTKTQAPAQIPATPGDVRLFKDPSTGKVITLGPDAKPLAAGAAQGTVIPNRSTLAPGQGISIGGPTPQGGRRDFGGIPVGGGQFGGGFGGRGGRGLGGATGDISMEFHSADINTVLKLFSEVGGWHIIPDPSLTGSVTIISNKRMTLDQAFEVLQSTLAVRGYTGQKEIKNGLTILRVIPFNQASPTSQIIPSNTNMDSLGSQVVTQVIPIENVDAPSLARELATMVNRGATITGSAGSNALIITDSADNIKRIRVMVDMLDKAPADTEMRVFPIKNSSAVDISQTITTIFNGIARNRQSAIGGGQPGQPGQPGGIPQGIDPAAMQAMMQGRGGIPGGGQPGGGRGGASGATVVATADVATNSVIVVAAKANMGQVSDLIKILDDPQASALESKILPLQYADATLTADVINQVIAGSGVGGRGGRAGASFQQRVMGGGGGFGGGGFGGFGGGGFGGQGGRGGAAGGDPFATVVAETRTNSLVVSATKEKMESIEKLAKQLDVPVKAESTTFVVQLKNAQAADLADTLTQAFGQMQGGNNGGFGNLFGFGGNNQNNRNTQRGTSRNQTRRTGTGSSSGSSFGGGGGFRSSRAAPISYEPIMQDGVPGVMTPQGFMPDVQDDGSATSRQFFLGGGGFGGGGFGGGQQNRGGQPVRGGGVGGNNSALLQFRQNVGVVADPGSNSLIIQATPEMMLSLKQVIDQLDIIPRQVMIEVIIAEASLDANQKLGFQFDGKGVAKIAGTDFNKSGGSNFGLGGGSVAGAIANPINPGVQFGLQSLTGNFNALVQALATDNKVRILSTPKVFTSNNMPANINITTSIPYVSGTFTSGLAGGSQSQTSFVEPGIILDVTPRITKDGRVTIDVYAEASEFLGFDTLSSSFDSSTGQTTTSVAPRTSSRTTETSVSVMDGEVIVLGGLMRESKTLTQNKVPLLGDIPILGSLFRSTNTQTNKTELMIFLIPHVSDSDAQTRALTEEQSKTIRKEFSNIGVRAPALRQENLNPRPGEPGYVEPVEKPKDAPKDKPKATEPKVGDPAKQKPPIDPDFPTPPAGGNAPPKTGT
jgi:general secretion pathway protein D